MKIKVGNYELDGTFSSAKEAKEVFITHFPGVTEADLDNVLKTKSFKDANKSDNAKGENTDSDKKHATPGKGGTGEK